MNPYITLFEFLNSLIEQQITKYLSLATKGIGPDAHINAYLVAHEVTELLELGEALLNKIDINLAIMPTDNPNIESIFEQIKFYIEQEALRARAGWLLDANNIHTPVMERVNKQLSELKQIAQEVHLNYSPQSKPVTDVQKQCEYDSHAIAFYILDLVKQIKEKPDIEFVDKIPAHALKIIKGNVTTRYNQEEFSTPINELHEHCKEYMEQSTRNKNTSALNKKNVEPYQILHKERLDKMRKRYNQIRAEIDTPLTQVSALPNDMNLTKINQASVKHANKFFTPLVVGVVLVSMLLAYFLARSQTNTSNEDAAFKP